ncbi:hypothetical protein [Bacillus thuringiensis]
MTNNWFKDMEKITICIGVAIVSLGVNNIFGGSIISPALVTGISLSGLFLTIADFLSKQFKDCENQWGLRVLYIIDFVLYSLAALCLIGYPNSTFIKSLDKDTLDWMSTSASVIALGVVFIAIGISNRNAVLEEERKKTEVIENILKDTKELLKDVQDVSKNERELSEQNSNLKEKMFEIIESQHEQIKGLKKEQIEQQIEQQKSTPSL